MLKKLNNILSQLHPGYSDLSVYLRTINGIGIGVFLLLVIFRPFHFTRRLICDSVWLTAFVNAGVCYITMLICVLWIKCFPKIFAAETWTLKRELGIITYQMTSITLSIWALNSFLGFYQPGIKSLGRALFAVFFTGIIPYGIVTFIRHNYLLQHRLKEANRINEKLRAMPENGIDEEALLLNCPQLLHPIKVSDFYYAESKGNDLYVYCIRHGEAVNYKMRSTLNQFIKMNEMNKSVFRCHRSFVMNLNKIMHVNGNAASYQVLLSKKFPLVPVSRSFISSFKEEVDY